jgi:hypothetical protein
MTAIRSGPHICSSSTSTSSVKQEVPIESLIASVTHYFGHSGDVFTVMCSGSHKDLLPEKSDCYPPLQNIFL